MLNALVITLVDCSVCATSVFLYQTSEEKYTNDEKSIKNALIHSSSYVTAYAAKYSIQEKR